MGYGKLPHSFKDERLVFICSHTLYETIMEEFKEIGLELENLFYAVEDSIEDVVWFFRLMGGKIIIDKSEVSWCKGDILDCFEFLESDIGQLFLKGVSYEND